MAPRPRSSLRAVLVSYRRVSSHSPKNQPKATLVPVKPVQRRSAAGSANRGSSMPSARSADASSTTNTRLAIKSWSRSSRPTWDEPHPGARGARALQNENFVQLIPRHGMRVVPLSIQELQEVYEVLTSLELTPSSGWRGPTSRAKRSPPLKSQSTKWIRRSRRRRGRLGPGRRALPPYPRDALRQPAAGRDGGNALGAESPGADDDGPVAASLELSNREHRALLDAIRQGDWRQARTRHAKHRERAMRPRSSTSLHQTRLGSF